jgi:subtilisin family serine protease
MTQKAHGEQFAVNGIDLARDPAMRIAVRSSQLGRQSLADRIRNAGAPEHSIETMDLDGWFVLTPLNARPIDIPNAWLDLLLLEGDIEYATPVFVDDFGGPLIPTANILYGLKRAADPIFAREVALAAIGAGANVDLAWLETTGVISAGTPFHRGEDVLQAAAAMRVHPDVAFAEPDMIFTGAGGTLRAEAAAPVYPNDPGFVDGQEWGLHNTGLGFGVDDIDVDAPEAWGVTIGDPSVIVVVIDTGVDLAHPDLTVAYGADFTSNAIETGGPFNSLDNHGTPVAGCVAAIMNNGIGAVGVAPGCSLASARTFITTSQSGSWNSQASWTVAALSWAAQIGASVTNNSNYYNFSSSAIAAAYDSTREAGLIHFASAGNFGSNIVTYPASLPSVHAIGSIQMNGVRASSSGGGAALALVGPGAHVYSTDRVGLWGYSSSDYGHFYGTSFASPHIAGVAALIRSHRSEATPEEVYSLLISNAKRLGPPLWNPLYGFGLPSAWQALAEQVKPVRPRYFDLNGDSVIDEADLAILVGAWGDADSSADLSGDRVVDGEDLRLLLTGWGPSP